MPMVNSQIQRSEISTKMTAAAMTNQISAIIASVLSSSLSIPPPPFVRPNTLKGVDELIHAGFEAYRASCFNWLLGATAVVAIGLVFEGPELTHEITSIVRHWRFTRRFRFSLPEAHAPEWAKLLAFVGWLLIVMGVAGEYVADSFVSKADGYVQTFDEIVLANAQKEVEIAKEKSGGAYERAATAEREAARLGKDAEDERLARVKIEAAVAWRSLDDKQKHDIGSALASFSPKAGASIWYDSSSTEAQMFADDIAEALRSGGITTTNVGGMMSMAEGGKWNGPIVKSPTGVILQSTNVPAAIEFAGAVLRELSNRGFDVIRTKDPPFEKGTSPVIWINVEGRPKGPQGEYKLQAEREAKAKNANIKSH
jgi:hypothetical protein